MSKAKPIDRVEYTKRRIIGRTEGGVLIAVAPITRVVVDGFFDKEHLSVTDCGTGAEVCPVCGAEVIHESGCVRCTCGWSRC